VLAFSGVSSSDYLPLIERTGSDYLHLSLHSTPACSHSMLIGSRYLQLIGCGPGRVRLSYTLTGRQEPASKVSN